jgi:diguanylate cyclase (GGDEF)-like protein
MTDQNGHRAHGQPDPGADGEAVAQALDGAPFGLTVFAADGRTLFSNQIAESFAADRPDAYEHRSFQVDVDGQQVSVRIDLDESEQRDRENNLLERAFFDSLTRLPNRLLIERSVTSLIEANEQKPFALAFFDLDGFKMVNDYYGHDVGDELLRRTAKRLEQHLRPTDMLARLSGDEFALLMSPIEDLDQAKADFDALCEQVKQPMLIDGHEIMTSASIGVSMFPDHGADFETLRANADRAMYRAKGTSKGRVQLFDEGIRHQSDERARQEQRLRLAIRDRRVTCAFQPKVELGSGSIVGVEVLMRWRDEDGIIQPPGNFLSLAIELGLIDELTYMVLNQTIDSIDKINDAFGRDSSISLNVAARQAGDAKFMRGLTQTIADSGFAQRIMLELTEEAFLAKSSFQKLILPMVREIGARVSIDDFGTGYSSLSALADITADEVKVDRSFITNVHERPRSQAVLKAIEALGHSLGMSIIVEGVETFEEVAYLQAATRIRYAQGYYYSKPIMLDEVGRPLQIQDDNRAPLNGPRAFSPSRRVG